MTLVPFALAAYCADNRVKLVHVWRTGHHWSAMAEWPYDPAAKRAVPTERHATGIGDTPTAAVIAVLERLQFGGWPLRLMMLTYVMGNG